MAGQRPIVTRRCTNADIMAIDVGLRGKTGRVVAMELWSIVGRRTVDQRRSSMGERALGKGQASMANIVVVMG